MLRPRRRVLLSFPLWLLSSSQSLRSPHHVRSGATRLASTKLAGGDSSVLAYIALGSNMGDRHAAIFEAFTALKSIGNVRATSHLYESRPMYVQEMEKSIGRRKSFLNGPRLIDMDILCITTKGGRNVDVEITASDAAPGLLVPHPRIEERVFVLQPLVDINPYIDIRGRTAKHWLDKLSMGEADALQRVVPIGAAGAVTRLVPCGIGSRVLISGVLNLTPDSFSDGGRYARVEDAVVEAMRMISQGADIVDVGGESSRPGSEAVAEDEEMRRVIPVITGIANNIANSTIAACISIDTRSSAVAKAAVEAGARLVNDVSGGRHDPEMFAVCARLGVPLCIMHSRGTPKTMASSEYTTYHNLVHDVCMELLQQTALCDGHLPRWMQIIDPGIGFSKTSEQNFLLLQPGNMRLLAAAVQDRLVLVGASRKRFLAQFTPQSESGLEIAADRDWATQGANAAAVLGGAGVIRVHNVPAARATVDTLSEIIGER